MEVFSSMLLVRGPLPRPALPPGVCLSMPTTSATEAAWFPELYPVLYSLTALGILGPRVSTSSLIRLDRTARTQAISSVADVTRLLVPLIKKAAPPLPQPFRMDLA